MPKGQLNKKYTGEFKQEVVETMIREKLGYVETAELFGLNKQGNNGYKRAQAWERIYLEEGAEGLYIERRGRGSISNGVQKGRSPKLDKKVEEDLIAEVQRLRAENDYLKKLNALVSKRERQEKKHK